MGTRFVETVYCNFSKQTSESGNQHKADEHSFFPACMIWAGLNYVNYLFTLIGFQTSVGVVDVKSFPVYFYVHKNQSFNELNTPIPFEAITTNEGGAMDISTGIFTAPCSGIYHFSFTGNVAYLGKKDYNIFEVGLFRNDFLVGVGWSQIPSTLTEAYTPNFDTFSFHSTLHLNKGDQISIQITGKEDWVFLTDYDGYHYIHYTGMLLEEDIYASVTGLNLNSNILEEDFTKENGTKICGNKKEC